jgi:hypothetical protein
MSTDQKDDATFKAVLILIDSLSAGARAMLRGELIKQGVTIPAPGKPGRKPRR